MSARLSIARTGAERGRAGGPGPTTGARTPGAEGNRTKREGARQARLLAGPRTADAFAERLSVHGDPGRAAAEIGKSRTHGVVLLRRIRAELGWQAR